MYFLFFPESEVFSVAKSASMYIRIDPAVKTEVEAIYSRYGMSVTEAINIFLYQSKNVGGLPFDLRPANTKNENGNVRSMKGFLKNYANPSLINLEKDAWEMAAIEKHDSL